MEPEQAGPCQGSGTFEMIYRPRELACSPVRPCLFRRIGSLLCSAESAQCTANIILWMLRTRNAAEQRL